MVDNDFFIDNSIVKNDLFTTKKNTFSHFNDKEVVRILKKVSNLNVKKLANYFERLKDDNEEYKIFRKVLHNICEELLKIYGSQIISLIYNLPFISDFEEVNEVHNILLNISIDDINFNGYKIPCGNEYIYLGIDRTIRYDIYNRKTYDHGSVLLMKKNKKNDYFSLLCRIKSDGKIDKDFINNLEFNIYSVINQKNKIELYSGSFDVRCRVCGRELNDPTSIYYGIGPECARNYG